MTIKRQLFFSNIRLVLVSSAALIATFLASRTVAEIIFRSPAFFSGSDFEHYRRFYGNIWFAGFIVFVILFIIINGIFSRRMTRKITVPLEILNRGVRQIQENNLSYRIEYNDDDEFRSVCETFNQMASELEDSARRRRKDEANRRELLVGISHDLRTPLTTISGYLEGLESGPAASNEMREKYIKTIKTTAANMKHMIEQLFLFSKLDMDEFPFNPGRFDIMRALSDIIEEQNDEYSGRGLNITLKHSPEKIFVHADVSHIRRVVINILENSVMYKTKKTGSLEICGELFIKEESNKEGASHNDAESPQKFIRLKFTDDGPGVSPEIIPNLFNVFFRADPSRHSDASNAAAFASGSGLGLAISAKIIERSGGSIYAAPAASGLAIIILLPIDGDNND